MSTGIEVVWWIGLLGALGMTLLILKEVFLVVRVLRQILQLADLTEVAARGIIVHTAAVPKLQGVPSVLAHIDDLVGHATQRLRNAANRLDDRLRDERGEAR